MLLVISNNGRPKKGYVLGNEINVNATIQLMIANSGKWSIKFEYYQNNHTTIIKEFSSK